MKCSLVLNIGTNSVVGGVVSEDRILYNTEEHFHPSEESMLVALEQVLKRLSHEGAVQMRSYGVEAPFDHVSITLSRPWAVSELSSREVKGDKAFHFNHHAAVPLIDEEVMKHRAKFDDHQILERTVGSLVVNGHRVSFPATQPGMHAVVGIFVSSVPKSLLRKIEDRVSSFFSTIRGVSVQTLTSLFHRVFFREHARGKALLALVGPYATEVLRMDHGHIALVNNIDLGYLDITDNAARVLGVSPVIAESYLDLFSRGKLHHSLLSRLENLLLSVEDKWHSLWTSEEKRDLPQTIFLVAPQSEAKVWETLFKSLNSKSHVHLLDQTLPLSARFSASLFELK